MKTLVAAVILTSLVPPFHAMAQRGPFSPGGGSGFGFSGTTGWHGFSGTTGWHGFRPFAPFGRQGANRPFFGGPGMFGSYFAPGYFPGVSSGLFGDYPAGDCDCEPGYQQPQNVLASPQPEVLPPPPPIRPRPVVREYNWPEAAPSAKAFSLALKDGTVRMAALVWVQDGAVHYTGSDGKAGSIPVSALDRVATNKLNEAGNLHLSLPVAGGR